MTTVEFLGSLRERGVSVSVVEGRLRLKAPPGAVDDALKQELQSRKDEIVRLLVSARGSESESMIPAAPAGPVRLSPGQERLWSLVSRTPDSDRYNLPLAFRIRGPLDEEALTKSVEEVANRHAILRSRITLSASGPLLTPHFDRLPIELTDLGSHDEDSLRQEVTAEARGPFDLEREQLIRVRLLRADPEHHVLTIVMHHIISDGWSFDVFLGELSKLYTAFVNGSASPLAPLPIQFSDFAHWERAELEQGRMDALHDQWAQQLEGPLESLEFEAPLEARDPSAGPDGRTRKTATLSPDLRGQLESLGAEEGATLFMVLLAAFQCALAHETGRRDFAVCSPAARRARTEVAPLIGYVNNVLALRATLSEDSSFRSLIIGVRKTTLRAHRGQDLPFQEVANLPAVRRVPLTRAMFALHSEKPFELALAGLDVTSYALAPTGADFDVSLTADATSDEIGLMVELNPRRVDTSVGERLLTSMQKTLERVVANPDALLSDLIGTSAAATSSEGPHIEFSEPNDDLELELVRIWEQVLDHHPIGVNDDFFSLGGHSLLAGQLFGRIEAELGRSLPLSTLFKTSTIAGLARALREDGWEPSKSVLVPIRSTGTGDPFFFPHSYEGHVLFANAVGRVLADSHPTYGLQAVGLHGRERPLDRVEAIADRHVRELRAARPDGPWLIVGMCFGVLTGFEVARRLYLEGGPRVEFIALDGAFDRLQPGRSWAPAPTLIGEIKRRIPAHTRGLVERIRRRSELARSTPHERMALTVRWAATRAARRYDPQPAPVRVTLIRTAEKASNPANDWQVESWRRLAAGGLRVVQVPGTHLTLMTSVGASGLADALRECARESP